MKKILKVIPFICILVVTLFFLFFKDSQQRVEYYAYKDYQFSSLTFNENAVTIDEDKILQLNDIAIKNNVVIVKQEYDMHTKKKHVYYSSDSLRGVLDSKPMPYTILKEEGVKSYASTEEMFDENQAYVIDDFLGNDKYNIYKFSLLLDNNVYLYDTYEIYYQDYGDLEKFYVDVSSAFHIPIDALQNQTGVFMGHANELFLGMIVCSSILLLLYFTLVLFDLYEQSKKIGCLKLLGFRTIDIVKNLLSKPILYYVIFSFVLLVICFFCVFNITFTNLCELAFLHCIILISSIILFYIALLIIVRNMQVASMVKNKNILQHLDRFCNVLKFIVISIIFSLTASITQTMSETYNSSKVLLKNEELLEFAVFPKISVDNGEHREAEKYLKFYELLTKQNDVPYVYADFRFYREVFDMSMELEQLMMATVDKNYLKIADLELLDEHGNRVVADENVMEYFAFPLSKKEIKDEYLERYKKSVTRHYEPLQKEFSNLVYYYKDRDFNSLDIQNENVEVSSPIIRVINGGYPISYLDRSIGLDIAGTGMTTALKIKLNDNEENIFQSLEGIIKEAGLQEVLVEHNLMSYSRYFSSQQANLRNALIIILMGILITFPLYVLTLLQSFSVYVEINSRRIFVKQSLGFSQKDIFRKLVFTNLAITLASFMILVPICSMALSVDWTILLLLSLFYFSIDYLLSFCIVRIMYLKKMSISLKGK